MSATPRRIAIRPLVEGDLDRLAAIDGGNGWNADPELWASFLADQRADRRLVVIAWGAGQALGYGTLVWSPTYDAFRQAHTPEINNLAVAFKNRRQGIASALIRHLEGSARRAGKTTIGLGVGLYADYGPAQRLYFKLGYRPDGHGVTYACRPVAPLEKIQLDDELVIWLSKPL